MHSHNLLLCFEIDYGVSVCELLWLWYFSLSILIGWQKARLPITQYGCISNAMNTPIFQIINCVHCDVGTNFCLKSFRSNKWSVPIVKLVIIDNRLSAFCPCWAHILSNVFSHICSVPYISALWPWHSFTMVNLHWSILYVNW